MQSYAELLPPTGVTHALAVPFLSPTARNLIVVRTSLLQIFSLFDAHSTTEDKEAGMKLALEAEYSLFGTVTDIDRVKVLNTKSGGEAVLLALRNAKLSLIEWDSERHSISTISIHYYEGDESISSPWVPDLSSCGSALSVDPGSRCAAFNFGLRNLAILPFHQAGDDLVIDDYDSEVSGAGQSKADENARQGNTYQTPYAPSFVLPLTALDPSLLHPISLTFLYEYREPTFGIMYSHVATSSALLYERKDVVFYTVFTLDLEQRASTTLLSVSRLPSDLFKVVALPPPVGGALLLGSNELVHVDQAGKTNAVGVNEFSRQISSFSMADRSDLALRLEGCIVERLDEQSGDLALILASGDVAVVTFRLDGRSVTGMSVHIPPTHADGKVMGSAASCSAFLGSGKAFVGSEDADSVLVEWSLAVPNGKTAPWRLHGKLGADDGVDVSDEDVSEEEGYEDDLYSTTQQREPQSVDDGSTSGMYSLRISDRLCNIGPLRDAVLGKNNSSTRSKDRIAGELELVASQSSDASGGLVILKREIEPRVVFSTEKMDTAESIWSVSVVLGSRVASSSVRSQQKESRHYLIVSNSRHGGGREDMDVFVVDGQALKPYRAPEFNPNADFSIDIGVLAGGSRVVQVLRGEIRSYDSGKSVRCMDGTSRF